MQKEKYLEYKTTEEFVLDPEFAFWVIHPNSEDDVFWSLFIQEHPEKGELIRNAAFIIKSLQPIEPEVPQQKLNDILQNVKKSDKTKKLNFYRGWRYAAGIALLVATGSLLWFTVQMNPSFPIKSDNGTFQKGRIILSNGSTHEFDTEQTIIRQTTSGNLTINNDTIDNSLDRKSSAMNQIIIPYGKRSDITLADGTHIWLNSGSQLSYPSEFKTDSREVYLSGEAFLEVKSNPDQPFYVITRDIKIKVLGTSFNVSSYNEDNTTQTVLLSGKVSAWKNKLFAQKVDLMPGERMTYDKTNENISKDKVDVRLHSSWINGYLIFDNVPITEVYKKLERFYNTEIIVDNSLEEITFSGKLDLKDNVKDVIDNISFASAVKVLENNGSYNIKK